MGTVKKNAHDASTLAGLEALLYQTLETELGGVQVYREAIRLATNRDLREEWTKYLVQTKHHVDVARSLLETAGLDPEANHPSRLPVRMIGENLVSTMMAVAASGDADAAQITAAECVVLAETKDHSNWELIGMVANHFEGELGDALEDAHDEVEDEEDEHVYHSAGWARELRIDSLGLKAALPPPEEENHVKSAVAAAKAKKARAHELS